MEIFTQDSFNEKIKDQKSIRIQTMINNYISKDFPKYLNTLNMEEIGQKNQEFTNKLILEFCKLWDIILTYETEEEYNIICDSFESILTKKIYNKIFSSTFEDKKMIIFLINF